MRKTARAAVLALTPPPHLHNASDQPTMDETANEQITRICREILAPLVASDGGEMYLVRFDADDVHIHLAGTCAGCPGATLTGDKIILPALRKVDPKLRLVLTTGFRIPNGALRL